MHSIVMYIFLLQVMSNVNSEQMGLAGRLHYKYIIITHENISIFFHSYIFNRIETPFFIAKTMIKQ